MSTDLTLLLSQRNDVFNILSMAGLEGHIKRFVWENHRVEIKAHRRTVSRLFYEHFVPSLASLNVSSFQSLLIKIFHKRRTSRYYFLFSIDDHFAEYGNVAWPISYYPGIQNVTAYHELNSWHAVLEHVTIWSNNMSKELLVPDLWSQSELRQQLIDIGFQQGSSEFTQFTSEEKIVIRQTLKYAEQQIQEQISLSRKEAEYVNERFIYLSQALDKLNRFDWKGVLVGTIMSIAVNLTVDTQTGKLIYEIIRHAFSHVTHLLN